jgi:hypothetical protein
VRGEKYRRFLLDFLGGNYLRSVAAPQTEAVALAEAATTIPWRGQELSYRSVPIAWGNEADPDLRHELYALWREACAALNPRRAERLSLMLERVEELDVGDYVQTWDELRGLQLERLTVQMRELLASTEDLYRDSLRDRLGGLELGLDTAERSDLSYLFRGTELDDGFPRRELVPTLVKTLRGLGFDLEDQRHITLDLTPRPTKSPRAFCAPISIPDDVRLVLRPHGGHQDYSTLLHEAGHAEHFGNVDPALPFGYQRLGDSSVTEGYAFLLQYLIVDPLWLRRYLDLGESDELRQFVLFQKLFMLRRYAAKLLYEHELHRAPEPSSMAETYAELLSSHLLVHYYPDEYLADVDDAFYSAQYLRAWIFEAQVRLFLRREYDEEWFRSQRAGRFIRDELWRQGQKYTAEELLGFMGYAGLDPEPLLAEIREALAR